MNKNLRYSRERTSINENDGFRKFGKQFDLVCSPSSRYTYHIHRLVTSPMSHRHIMTHLLCVIIYDSWFNGINEVTSKVYTYLDEANTLDAPKIFKCLILFNIMRFPMIMLPNVINWALRAQVSLRLVFQTSYCVEKF